MAESSEVLSHPVFGTLRWQADPYGEWVTQYPLPSGASLDVRLRPHGGDRHEFLPRAVELFEWALKNEGGMRSEAVRAELLERYNEDWRQDGEARLSAKELAARLSWRGLSVSDDDLVAVEFSYDAGELFGGHEVAVEVDGERRFRDVDLRG